MKKILVLIGLTILFLAPSISYSQKQLVILKREKVKLRLYPGDEIVFRLKGSKDIYRSYVNNIYDTALMVHQDVIPFHKIDRIYFKQSSFANVIGGLLVVGGVGYFLIDFINVAVVSGDKYEADDGVVAASATMVAIGLPMMLIHKNSQKLGGKYRILPVEKGSPFFVPNPKSFTEY